MLKTDASQRLSAALGECRDEQFSWVKTMMEKGAGLLGLPDGAFPPSPQDVHGDRRDVLASLADAVYDCAKDNDFPMPRAGGWEYVIATLVIEQDWETIKKSAAELTEQGDET